MSKSILTLLEELSSKIDRLSEKLSEVEKNLMKFIAKNR